MSSPARKTKPSPPKRSPYDLNPTYSAIIPSFFSCQSPMQQGLMGIVITYLKQNNRYEALERFARCRDPARRGSYKHMVAVCMGRDHPTNFAKLSISRLCKHEDCGSAQEHPIFPMSEDERLECFRRFCQWLMLTNETTKLRAMKKCIPKFEDPNGHLLALEAEITTFLAQSEGPPSSAGRKRKRDTTETTTPSKQKKVSGGPSKSIAAQPFPLATARDTTPRASLDFIAQPFPLAPSDDEDDEVEFVEGPSSTNISRKESAAPVAGSSSLGKKPSEGVELRWILYLSRACDDLEEAAKGDNMHNPLLGPKLLALAETIYNNC
ncbi:hypothetical protein BT96DRAFT_944570 [Gymnopus androsaceus JB14]|uniref:Uncharacterized protein n=1 Tax=Gymnopus androsaceus JB14 TaxID=1447944 RepID=A0A6A4H427_9AGAR|nr:hypothetical protein BT96DRAFT_944570 [Gymnopus androsaceus JB14]